MLAAAVLWMAGPAAADDLARAKQETERANRAWVDAERDVERAERELSNARRQREQVSGYLRDLPRTLQREQARANQLVGELQMVQRDRDLFARDLDRVQGHLNDLDRSMAPVRARLELATEHIRSAQAMARESVREMPEYVAAHQAAEDARREMDQAIAMATARLERTPIYRELLADYESAERTLARERGAYRADPGRVARAAERMARAQSAVQALRAEFLKGEPAIAQTEAIYGTRKSELVAIETRLIDGLLATDGGYAQAQADRQEAERTLSRMQADYDALDREARQISAKLRDVDAAGTRVTMALRNVESGIAQLSADLHSAEYGSRDADREVRTAERRLDDARRDRDRARRRLDEARNREEAAARQTHKSSDPPRVHRRR